MARDLETSKENNEGGSPDGSWLLGFDLSTSRCALVLGYGETTLAKREFMADRHRTKLLVPAVAESIGEIRAEKDGLLAVAVGTGPGNFTGVRVAVATAKALAFGWRLHVLGINSLDILAEESRGSEGVVLAFLDAKRSQIYCAFYRHGAEGLSRISDYKCIEPVLLPKLLEESGVGENERLQVVGEGAILYKEALHRELGGILEFPDRDKMYPGAEHLLRLATAAWERGEAVSPQALRPLYLKRPVGRLPGRKDR